MPNRKHETDIKTRIEQMEKEMFHLAGSERAKARLEYNRLLKTYRKECGLEESIYLVRA